MLMQMIFVFYSIYFSIYVYGISGEINFVLACNLFQIICNLLIQYIITPWLNKKTYNVFYRMSFILVLISISLIFTIKSETLYMVFVVEMFYSFSVICYYVPHEIVIMNKNSSNQMKSFLGLSTSVAMISSFLAPFISGYIIDFISYYHLFLILTVLSISCFIFSFFIKNDYVNTRKMKIGSFIKQAMPIKSLRYSYISFGFYKISQESAVSVLLPILLFLQVHTNFSVGLYSALASFVSAITLLLYVRFVKKKYTAFILCSISIVLSATILVFLPSIATFFVYYFVCKICGQILINGVNENIFSATKGTVFDKYKKEHHFTFSLSNYIFQSIGCGLAFLIYNFMRNASSIIVIVLLLNSLIFMSNYFLIKSDKVKKPTSISKI